LRIGSIRQRQYAAGIFPLLAEYERIAVGVTRTTALYFLKAAFVADLPEI
jgi:hypothetical protein